jgi:peptide/nickel transport system permease protein
MALKSWKTRAMSKVTRATRLLEQAGVAFGRAAVLDVLSQEFVLTLRAKGLDEGAITRHVLRNALPQVIAVVALQFGYLMGGSILVETVFSWPGTGYLLGYAIQNRDVPLLQGIVLVLSMIFVVTNLTADLLQVRVDPRLRRG